MHPLHFSNCSTFMSKARGIIVFHASVDVQDLHMMQSAHTHCNNSSMHKIAFSVFHSSRLCSITQNYDNSKTISWSDLKQYNHLSSKQGANTERQLTSHTMKKYSLASRLKQGIWLVSRGCKHQTHKTRFPYIS